MHKEVKEFVTEQSNEVAEAVEGLLVALGHDPRWAATEVAPKLRARIKQIADTAYATGVEVAGRSELLLRERGKLAKSLAEVDRQLAKAGLELTAQPLVQVGFQKQDERPEPQPQPQLDRYGGRKPGFAAIANNSV